MNGLRISVKMPTYFWTSIRMTPTRKPKQSDV